MPLPKPVAEGSIYLGLRFHRQTLAESAKVRFVFVADECVLVRI